LSLPIPEPHTPRLCNGVVPRRLSYETWGRVSPSHGPFFPNGLRESQGGGRVDVSGLPPVAALSLYDEGSAFCRAARVPSELPLWDRLERPRHRLLVAGLVAKR